MGTWQHRSWKVPRGSRTKRESGGRHEMSATQMIYFDRVGGIGWGGQVGVWDSVWFDRPFLCKRTKVGWVRALMAPSGDRSGNSAFGVHNIYAHGLFNIFRSGSCGAIWWERGWVPKKGNIQSWQWWQAIPYQIPLTNIPDLTSYPINVNLYTYFHI